MVALRFSDLQLFSIFASCKNKRNEDENVDKEALKPIFAQLLK